MKLAAHKCHAFRIIKDRKSFVCDYPELKVAEMRIPYLEVDESAKYLGVRVGAWRGVMRGRVQVNITEAVSLLSSLPLKIGQKLKMLGTFIIPHKRDGDSRHRWSAAADREGSASLAALRNGESSIYEKERRRFGDPQSREAGHSCADQTMGRNEGL